MKLWARNLEATSPDFLPVIASMVALRKHVDVRGSANALLSAEIECDALYQIDSDRTSTNNELLPSLSLALAQLGQEPVTPSWALVCLAKDEALHALESGEDLARAAQKLSFQWDECESIAALNFIAATYVLDCWPPTESWEFALADELRAGMRKLIDLSVDDLLTLCTSD